jgi:hypothetical protein
VAQEDKSVYTPGSKNIQLNFSGIGCWLTLIGGAFLLGAIGLGWVVKSVFVLLLLLILAPVIAFVGFRWWLSRNVVDGACPVCQTPLTGLNQMQTACPNCQTPLQVTRQGFIRFTPEGTVEVSAVDVTSTASGLETEAVEVTVEVLPPSDDD